MARESKIDDVIKEAKDEGSGWLRVPGGISYQPPVDRCTKCKVEIPRHASAKTCISCARQACALLDDESWETLAEGCYATARKTNKGPGSCSRCESCYGTKTISYTKEVGGLKYCTSEPCPGAELEIRLALFNGAQCPGRHHAVEFDGFEGVHASQAKAKIDIRRWCESMKAGSRGWLLSGKSGRGKTHLLVSLVRYLTIHRGLMVKYLDWGELIRKMKSSFDARDNASESIQDSYATVPILIIDEIGKGPVTEWRAELLETLVDRRYRNPSLTTCAACNRGDLDITMSGRENAAMRVTSRLSEIMHARLIEGHDRRPHIGGLYGGESA